MTDFETIWRKRIEINTKTFGDEVTETARNKSNAEDPILYTKELITNLRESTPEDIVQTIFCKSACHMPHQKLLEVRNVYQSTHSLVETHKALQDMFRVDIKQYKNLSDDQVEDILHKGWGAAGILDGNRIIATKIPSKFHEYFEETDSQKKKYLYCHCPRVKKALLENTSIDSIYCNCGGGFYQDIWEHITGNQVHVQTIKNLFDGDDVCQFQISIEEEDNV